MNHVNMRSVLILMFVLFFAAMAMAADQGQRQRETERTYNQPPPTGRTESAPRSQGAWGDSMNREDLAEERQNADDAVTGAANVIHGITGATDEKAIPKSAFEQAEGIIVVPEVIRAGLIVGGRFGRGVLMTKNQDQWSLPVIVTITGASIGVQAGAETSDLIMIFRNKEDIQNLVEGNDFNLGADATIAAGELGAKAKGMVTEADVVTYRHTQGLFAGVALTGGALNVDGDAMYAYYGLEDASLRAYYGEDESQMSQQVLTADQKDEQGRQIFERAPQSAKDLQKQMNEIN